MNRNKKHTDWTDALRDRLRDASLPLEDGWARQAPVSGPMDVRQPRRAGGTWAGWGWALAGAATVLAAALFLRPAAPDRQPGVSPAGPEPVRLVEAPAGMPVSDEAYDRLVAQAQAQVQAPPAARRTQLSSVRAANEDGHAKKDQPSSERASNEDGPTKTTPPSSETAPNEEGPGNTDRSSSKLALDEDQAARNGVAAGQRSRDGVSRADVAAAGVSDVVAAGDPEATWLDDEERAGRSRRPVSLRLQAAGPGVSLASGGGTTSNTPQSDVPYSNSDKTIGGPQPAGTPGPASRQPAPFPISVGVSAALPLSRSWSLAAGLDYTQRTGATNLTLHYLGLPLDLHYYFNPESRLRIWLGGGLKAEKCIYVSGVESRPDPMLFSWNLQAGLDLRVLPGVRLYLAPALSQYLNHSVYTVSWDEDPAVSLRVGLSFDLK